MDRRSALVLIALDGLSARYLIAQQHAGTHGRVTTLPPLPTELQFLHKDEFALVHRLCDLILPTDENSPGATEANVARFIDFILSKSPVADQQRWRAGLKAFEEFAVALGSGKFVNLMQDAQARLLDAASTGTAPAEARDFFELLRKETIFAYYTTEIGLLRELGYRGNQVVSGFPGCRS
jgi:hypothetical protein